MAGATTTAQTSGNKSAAARRQSSIEEDVISIDSASTNNVIDANTGQPIAFSKKAIHQRDADENLFLRFLELDPPPDSASVASGTSQRRMSVKPSAGRTPFTITKRLSRTADKGFGFSMVWTHPPRVEKVEPGLSADRAGIVPGDYVIFVDKHNVVTMPESDVLNLIRSQGNSLNLEIFRRSAASGVPAFNTASRPSAVVTNVNGISKPQKISCGAASSNYTEEMSPALKQSIALGPRSSTACSNASIETTKRRLHLPQVTFSKESITPCHGVDDQRRRILLQLVSREQNFTNALQFGMQRFVTPLLERRDLISPNDHRTLFQNIDELMRISEDILEQLIQDDHEPQINFASRVYLSKTTAICAAYKKYCNGIKRADCVLVNKSRQPGSEFVSYITEPQVPRKRPDLTMFIHRPLQHFREILKLMQLLASHCRVDSEEHKNFTSVINELQAAYREITVGGGLMEPLGEGRPLLTLQDLESRMVFTRCKPFTLAVQGRQWIFGGDLSRVEGRSVKPYWTLLFSDILLFAKVSRDRVLFITEEPLPIVNIVDSYFNIRKKNTEFRVTVDPNGRAAESPTAYCAPDLSRTPRKNTRRKSLILRAPSPELKAVWQNLLQRQIFLVNAALGSTPLSSPLDSPDVLNTLVPLSDIGATTTSMASIKLSSMDSINMKNQQNSNHAQQIDLLIDEKCRILNKTGTPKGSALHLANWMKGQLDKQQEEARLAAEAQQQELDDNDNLPGPPDEEERITYWTREQLEKRTKELNLSKENGNLKQSHPGSGGKRLGGGGVEEIVISDCDEEVKSPSRSTTSDSQITVRSSPIANLVDKLSVCRHCHKNCKQKLSPSPPLLSNSLKVQHSQASPNRCCQLSSLANNIANSSNINGIASSASEPSTSVAASSTSTGNISSATPTPMWMSSGVSSASSTLTSEPSQTKRNSSIPKDSKRNLTLASSSSTSRLLNGNCSGSESDRDTASVVTTTSTNTSTTSALTKSTTVTTCSSHRNYAKDQQKPHQHQHPHPIKPNSKRTICNCKCTPEDFSNTTLSPDEIKQETCKLLDDVSQVTTSPKQKRPEDLHRNCKCICKDSERSDPTEEGKSDVDWSLVLIGLAQFNPAAKLVNSDAFVPSISVVPPTPDAMLTKTQTNIWDNTSTATKLSNYNVPGRAVIENIPEDSPDESPQDEDPPYHSLNTTLRRHGTLSSLEKVPSDEINEQEDSSDEEEIEEDGGDDDDVDIEVITREVFTDNNQASLRNWTARAGSYVAEKISFFEESRAFIDKYFNRWNQEPDPDRVGEEEQLDECTSGATSGEEVWGTPTSGGDNDDMQINSDHTQSSPTKSSSSLTGDDDTELMMDELLMAPPMTASTIRGLLPRRRLEPLFEEETESDEERTQPDIDLVKKGETSANGHDLKDSIGKVNEITIPPRTNAQLSPPPTTVNTNTPQKTSAPSASEKMAVAAVRDSVDPQRVTMATLGTSPVKSTIITVAATTSSTTVTATPTPVTAAGPPPPPNVVRRAKFSPPPPPPRRLLLTQSDSKKTQVPSPTRTVVAGTGNIGKPLRSSSTQAGEGQKSGATADSCYSADARNRSLTAKESGTTARPSGKAISQGIAEATAKSIKDPEVRDVRQSVQKLTPVQTSSTAVTSTTMATGTTMTPASASASESTASTTTSETGEETTPVRTAAVPGSGLSPRLEMRLALNNDIMGDEDLINYDPGPDLTTILGHDLSTFHRLTGRDLLNRLANRVQPKEAVISYSQQRNSKMDTPTLNRKRQQLQNRNTWSNSAFVDRVGASGTSAASYRNSNNSSEESKLSDLELLAKREKIYCKSQLKSGSPARTTRSSSLIGMGMGTDPPTRKSYREDDAAKDETRSNRFFNFLSRRNSENQLTKMFSRDSLNDSNPSSTPRILSPRKDNDKPPLNRRFWKQLTKRRRAHSVSEIAAS